MLKDIASKYIESELKYGEKREMYHYNCAETMLYACNDYYDLNMDTKMLRAIVPLGIMYSEDKPTLNERLKNITKKWVTEFEKEFGNINCDIIKVKHRDEIEKCVPVMIRATEIFEGVIDQ